MSAFIEQAGQRADMFHKIWPEGAPETCRAQNALEREFPEQPITPAMVARLTVGELRRMPGAGSVSVARIIEWLVLNGQKPAGADIERPTPLRVDGEIVSDLRLIVKCILNLISKIEGAQ